jgi:putative protease
VEACDENGLATCSLRNKFRKGDELDLVSPDTRPFAFTAGEMWDGENLPLEEPKKPEMVFTIQLPKSVPAKSIIRKAVDLSAK